MDAREGSREPDRAPELQQGLRTSDGGVMPRLLEALRRLSLHEKFPLWMYRIQNMLWVWLGLAGMLACFQFFLDPSSIAETSLGKQLSGPVDDAWNLCFGIGGFVIAAGVWRSE